MSQPITLTQRALVALVLAIAALSAAVAIAVADLTQPADADAAAARAAVLSQGDRVIVSQLKTLNRNVSSIKSAIGTSAYDTGSLRSDLRGYFGITGDVRNLIRDTCRNTQDINPPGAPCF